MKIKYEFIPGLENIVTDEIATSLKLPILYARKGVFYTVAPSRDADLKTLHSVNNVYYTNSDDTFNPRYIRRNTEHLFQVIDKVITQDKFNSFNINCAGDTSKEIQAINNQIKNRYHIPFEKEADLQINYGKTINEWDISVRLTNRPLSLRSWRVENIPGGLNPTIAYAMNVLTNPQSNDNYLNIFSGSGTLLIERAHWPSKSMIGIDINGLYNSYAIKNIKKADLIKRIQIKNFDINNLPEIGKFDVITANLPFGIQQGKDDDLNELYKNFMLACSKLLNKNGRLVCYTVNDKLVKKHAKESGIKFKEEISLEVQTSIGTKLLPKILYNT